MEEIVCPKKLGVGHESLVSDKPTRGGKRHDDPGVDAKDSDRSDPAEQFHFGDPAGKNFGGLSESAKSKPLMKASFRIFSIFA